MFFAASMLFSPVMLEGKRLNQGDTQNNIGMAKEAAMCNSKRARSRIDYSMFGGMPTTQITGTDIDRAVVDVDGDSKVIPIEVGTIVVAMLSAYVLGLCLGLSPWLSLLLGLGFGLSSLNVLYLSAGHATKVWPSPPCPACWRGSSWPTVGACGRVRVWRLALHFGGRPRPNDLLPPVFLCAVSVAVRIRAGLNGEGVKVAKTTGVLALQDCCPSCRKRANWP